MKPTFKTEKDLWNKGYDLVCGIDEAGRGAIAGPLVSAAVILKPKSTLRYNDSKLLSAQKRKELFEILKQEAISWSVGIASVDEINEFGIQSATYLSYERAYKLLNPLPNFLLIDHYRMPGTLIPQLSITKGDRISQSIAAASIIAKQTRDSMMCELAGKFKEYLLDRHMGYGTKAHIALVDEFGISSIHRKKFIDKSGKIKLNFN